MSETLGIDTHVLHSGHHPDSETLSRAVPIYQTTSYAFRDTDHAANLFALKEFGNIYTRLMNPTTEVLEKRLAAMHGGTAALATASGMAAIFYAVCGITRAGGNVVSGAKLYGGTRTLFQHTLSRFGIEARFVDSSSLDQVRAAIDGKTTLVYTESVGNPTGNVDDLAGMAEIAHAQGIPFVVDNTVVPPPIFNPFDVGADVVVYSLTKMIGGHGTSVGGAIVEKGDFDWSASGRFPDICEDDPSYHGMNFWQAFGSHADAAVPGIALSVKLRTGMLRDTGACLSPFNAFQILQGVETLPLRARRHCENARRIATFLSEHPAVTEVTYSGLPEHRDAARVRELMPLGPGAVFGFHVRGGYEAGRAFIDHVELCSHLANILDARTLVIHPASTTHQQLTKDELSAAGIDAGLVRISVGLEDAADIEADLDQALKAAIGTEA